MLLRYLVDTISLSSRLSINITNTMLNEIKERQVVRTKPHIQSGKEVKHDIEAVLAALYPDRYNVLKVLKVHSAAKSARDLPDQ